MAMQPFKRGRIFHDLEIMLGLCVSVASVGSDSLRLPPGSSGWPWDSPGKNTGVGCHSLLQGLLPSLGSIPGLLHCRRILYRLIHQGSPAHTI